MCGIAGAIGYVDAEALKALRQMSDAQRHRGPDDDGFWKSFDGDRCDAGTPLAFRRLAIIDLTPDGHQPMIDPETGNVIIFNGEIYNYRLLRTELEREGVRFRSKSDTEVLLKAYGRWGVECVQKLRGMFAFAIWDARQKQVVLARDRVGIKPLYIARVRTQQGRDVLLFASELRALLASGLVPRRVNAASLSSFVWNGFVVGPDTIIQGVQLLPAGAIAMVRSDTAECSPAKYWDLPHQGAAQASTERLRHELSTSVQQHMISDVPLGIFLSGGIDSSAIASLAAQAGGNDVCTFNISFDESQYDESRHARAVADALGTKHTEVRLTQNIFRRQLLDALESVDQPTFDGINSYFVSRAVREAGLTVALAGTGGDELFGGYASFIDIPKAARWSRRMARVPQAALRVVANQIAHAKVGSFGEVPPQTRWGKLADVLATRGNLVDLYQTSYGLFTRDFINQLLRHRMNGEVRSGLPRVRAHELAQLVGASASLDAISILELSCFIGERLLRDTDAASMAVSLEARVPLLDHEVIEAAAAIDPSIRFQPLGQKQLLRDLALKGLDPALFDRPKSGFVLPIDVWCREQLRDQLEAAFSDRGRCEAAGLNPDAVARLWRAFQAGAPGIYWSRIWSLFVLLWWLERHNVSM